MANSNSENFVNGYLLSAGFKLLQIPRTEPTRYGRVAVVPRSCITIKLIQSSVHYLSFEFLQCNIFAGNKCLTIVMMYNIPPLKLKIFLNPL